MTNQQIDREGFEFAQRAFAEGDLDALSDRLESQRQERARQKADRARQLREPAGLSDTQTEETEVCAHCGQLVPPLLKWLHETVRPQAQERHLRRDKEDYR